MIDTTHPTLSVRKQAKLLDVNRNRLKPRQQKLSLEDHEIMSKLDEIYMESILWTA